MVWNDFQASSQILWNWHSLIYSLLLQHVQETGLVLYARPWSHSNDAESSFPHCWKGLQRLFFFSCRSQDMNVFTSVHCHKFTWFLSSCMFRLHCRCFFLIFQLDRVLLALWLNTSKYLFVSSESILWVVSVDMPSVFPRERRGLCSMKDLYQSQPADYFSA